jgi:hypothetical protein
MSTFLKYSAIALLAFVTFVPIASACQVDVILQQEALTQTNGITNAASGPANWNAPGYFLVPTMGEVQITTKHKGDSILVDGGFAGRTGELKKFSLKPGTHTIELRNSDGKTLYQEKITVVVGKKVKIQPDSIG